MKPAHVTLMFTSDEHGYLKPARNLQTAVHKARQDNPEGTLLLSSGDFFEGSADTGILGIQASQDVMKKAGYDVMTVGNHDFDRGPEIAKKWVKDSPARVLVANVKDSQTGHLLEGSEASHVFQVGEAKFGLIGVTTPDTALILPADKQVGLQFESPTEAVKAEVAKLKAQGIETIGLISHLGLTVDRKMASDVPELDFILGGHSHDATKTPEQVGKTLIAHPGCFRQSMGRLDFDISPETGLIADPQFQLLQASQHSEDQGDLGQYIAEKEAIVDAELSRPVAHLSNELSFNPNVPNNDMSAVVNDAALKVTGADMSLINVKLTRQGLPQGEVTRKDIFNVLPFDNRITTTEMTANEVMAALTESHRRASQTSLSDVSPIQMVYDIYTRQPKLLQIAPDAEILEGGFVKTEIGKESWVEIPGEQKLKVATTDYLLSGGLGYLQGSQKGLQDFGTAREVLEDYLEENFER